MRWLKAATLLVFLICSQQAKCQLKVGDHYAGGIIFYLDSSGEHGEVLADQAVGDFSVRTFKLSIIDTVRLAGFSDWIIPSGEQMALVYQNVKKDRDRMSVCGGGTFWISNVSSVDLYDKSKKIYGLYSLTQGIGRDPADDSEITYPIRPIRKF